MARQGAFFIWDRGADYCWFLKQEKVFHDNLQWTSAESKQELEIQHTGWRGFLSDAGTDPELYCALCPSAKGDYRAGWFADQHPQPEHGAITAGLTQAF